MAGTIQSVSVVVCNSSPYRKAYSSRPTSEAVTEGHINAAARSLAQTRTDLAARMAEVDALNSASNDSDVGKGFFSMFSSSPNAASKS